MNILVIGNGFDLAHGLCTEYKSFLKWIDVAKYIIQNGEGCNLDNFNWKKDDYKIRSYIENDYKDKKEYFFLSPPWKEMIEENIWVEYFKSSKTYQGDGWIDFENEMSNLIQVLEIVDKKIDNEESLDHLRKSQKDVLNRISKNKFKKNIKKALLENLKPISEVYHINNIEEILDILEMFGAFKKIQKSDEVEEMLYKNDILTMLKEDLNKLILLLGKYLLNYISNQTINKISLDIKGICVDKVLSFNYTDTYEKVYDKKSIELVIEYNYIHGEIQEDKENNMVLGIEEYLSDDRKDKDVKYIAFKKYYQRICKGTGNKYKDWVEEIKESRRMIECELRKEFSIQIPINKFSEEARHRLYIFGHSLDVTDRDVLRDLILNDNVYTTIFYFKRKDLEKKIANLVKVIGQDELIRRTGGSTKTIEFKLQQDMVEKKYLLEETGS